MATSPIRQVAPYLVSAAVAGAALLIGAVVLDEFWTYTASPEARFHQGLMAWKLDGNGRLAVERLMPFAKTGNSEAAYIVAYIYATGNEGVPEDDAKALYWFRRTGPAWIGASKTDLEGQKNPDISAALYLADVYADGEDFHPPDPARREKWLKLAARDGSKLAAVMLAQPFTPCTVLPCKPPAISARATPE